MWRNENLTILHCSFQQIFLIVLNTGATNCSLSHGWVLKSQVQVILSSQCVSDSHSGRGGSGDCGGNSDEGGKLYQTTDHLLFPPRKSSPSDAENDHFTSHHMQLDHG